jgi:hypothetical protein
MKKQIAISKKVTALIPNGQLRATQECPEVFADALERLQMLLNSCPDIGKTDGMKEHPAVFHYFGYGTDIYICEYDGKDAMFGFGIIGGDVHSSEFGYFSRSELKSISVMNIDYYFDNQSIEAARYKNYPHYFKKPQSLEQ